MRLAPEEVAAARRHLAVLPSGASFEQPCSALADAGCTIYEARPAACRNFVCRLYARHAREGGPLEERLAVVRRTRELLAIVLGSSEPSPEIPELVRRMEDFARA